MSPAFTSRPQAKTQHTSTAIAQPHGRLSGESCAFLPSLSWPSGFQYSCYFLLRQLGLGIYQTKGKVQLRKKINSISTSRGKNHRPTPVCDAPFFFYFEVDRWTRRAESRDQTPPRQRALSIPSWQQEGFGGFFNICRSLQTTAPAKFPHKSQEELMRMIAQPLNQMQGFNISWMLDKSWSRWRFRVQVK